MNEYEVGTTIKADVTFRDEDDALYDPTTVTAFVEQPDGTIYTVVTITNPSVGYYYFHYTILSEGDHMYQFTGVTGSISSVESSFFVAVEYVHDDLDYLIQDLRFHMGDISELKYNTDFLRQALIIGIKALMRKWRNKYLYASGVVSRNVGVAYEYAAPPVIQYSDERPIMLQAAIIIKSADLQDSGWDIASWRDDEIAYSNIAGSKALLDSLQRDIDELELWLRSRLFGGSRQSLEGFRLPRNQREGYA